MDFGNYSKAKLILYSILDKIIKKEGSNSEAYRAVSGCISEISDAETAERLRYEADREELKSVTKNLINNLTGQQQGGLNDDTIN